MARVQSVDFPDELRDLYNKTYEKRDRFILGVVQSHKHLLSRTQKNLLRRTAIVNSPQQGRGSLFKYLSPFWRSLTNEAKNNWRERAVFSHWTNWQLFISDSAARIRNDISFPVLPKEETQVHAGIISISPPDSKVIIEQEHPQDYYISSRIRGGKGKREVVHVRETFSLPLSFTISYSSDLSAVGSFQEFRIFARIWHSYQGEDLYTDLDLQVSSSSDWVRVSSSISKIKGILISYSLIIHIEGYTGEVFFDNIKIVHSGTNWARDKICKEINKNFIKGFAVVLPNWRAAAIGEHSVFFSDFPPSL
jgi:hypothetical protein